MDKKENPPVEYLKKKLEEKIHESINYFELFTDTRIPSNWHIYYFNNSYLIEKDKYTVVKYIQERDENMLCSTSLAVFDHSKDCYIFLSSCQDEG